MALRPGAVYLCTFWCIIFNLIAPALSFSLTAPSLRRGVVPLLSRHLPKCYTGGKGFGSNGILRVSFRAGRFVSGMCMSLAQEPEGQSTTEKLFRELLQVKEAQLREKEEASKKQEEVSKALLAAKDDLLDKQQATVAKLERDYSKLRSEKEAVLVNRVMLEMTVAHAKKHDASPGKGLKGKSQTQVCEWFAREHFVHANNTLNAEAEAILRQLESECCGLQGTPGEQVGKKLQSLYKTLSEEIHHPDWGTLLPDGLYAGGVSRIVDAALGIWIVKAQRLGIIDFPVRLVGSDNQPGCEIRDGQVKKVLDTST